MFNFDFYNPTHIVFGKDRLDELDTLVPKDAKVLITYGGGSAVRSGLIDRIVNCLLYTSPSPRDTERSRMPSSA